MKKVITVYPAMWNPADKIPSAEIAVPDKLIKYALPKADAIIRNQMKKNKYISLADKNK